MRFAPLVRLHCDPRTTETGACDHQRTLCALPDRELPFGGSAFLSLTRIFHPDPPLHGRCSTDRRLVRRETTRIRLLPLLLSPRLRQPPAPHGAPTRSFANRRGISTFERGRGQCTGWKPD